MVKIRLARHGRHKRPLYRIVVADSQSPRDGRFIEVLGTYDPLVKESGVQVDTNKVKSWLNRGAQMTDTVRHLVKRVGVGAASTRTA
jgi:small subunit ribosomal protein S16